MKPELEANQMREITAPYLLSQFKALAEDYYPYYILIKYSRWDLLSFHHLSSYKQADNKNNGRGDIRNPLKTYTLREFLSKADTFNPRDTFAVCVIEDMLCFECQFDSEVIMTLYAEHLRYSCLISLLAKKILTPNEILISDSFIQPEDYNALSEIIIQANRLIIEKLQKEYCEIKDMYRYKKQTAKDSD